MTARFVTDDDQPSQSGLSRYLGGVVIVGLLALGVASGKLAATLIILSILLMIMLHELGHFVTAKWAGMKVTDFFLGFGPTIWSVKRGDTRYGIKAIPAGGFVRVIGMNNLDPIEEDEDESQTYRSKTYFQRVRFAAAGSFMHFLIAFVLLVALLAGFGRYNFDKPPTTTIDSVADSLTTNGPASPAAAAGLRNGDKIVAIGETPITKWVTAQRIIRTSPGKPLDMTIERDGTRFGVTVTPTVSPSDMLVEGEKPFGMVGLSPGAVKETYTIPSAVWNAGSEFGSIVKESAGGLVGLFSKSSLAKYTEQVGKRGPADPSEETNRFVSPIGLPRVADAAAKQGGAGVLSLLISINIFVGLFNLIPLPPFDGGHIAVATYEAIRSKIRGQRYAADGAKLIPVALAVISALVVLSVSTMWLDIVHPFNLG